MRRKHIPPVVRGFVTRVCTVFGQFCTEGITFSVGSRPSDRVRGQSSRPWDNKGPGLKKHFFSTLWASVWSKNKGGPGPLPLICHWHVLSAFTHTVMSYEQDIKQLSSESSNNNLFLGDFCRYAGMAWLAQLFSSFNHLGARGRKERSPRPWSCALIPFPFPFERLPRTLFASMPSVAT